jgi:hypothetical protein
MNRHERLQPWNMRNPEPAAKCKCVHQQ